MVTLRRRLTLCLVSAGSLLFLYMLCVNLQGPQAWSMVAPKHPQGNGSVPRRDLEDPLDPRTSPDPDQDPDQDQDQVQDQDQDQDQDPVAMTLAPNLWTRATHQNTTTVKTQTLKPNNASKAGSGSKTSGTGTGTGTGTRTGTGTGTRTVPPTVHRQPPTRPSGPTEPPFIGDSYMSEDLPPQTDCPDGVGTRVSGSEFGGRFLKHIPVLQSSNHVSRELHQRLSRYPGAHGWGNIDFQTLQDTLSVLNVSANRRLLDDWRQRGNESECIRCAVVGNGGILKASRRGDEIDAHHYVFRTNGAVIRGFEQDVGSRTTHYTFSTNTLMNSMRSYAGLGYRGPPKTKETRYVFLPDHDRDYLLMKAAATHRKVERGPERNKDPTVYFGSDVSVDRLKMYHPDFIRYLRNRFLRSHALKTKYKDIYRPSTGAVMLLAALHTCDQVSAYGFMTPDYRKYSDHYYDSQFRPVGFFINHDLKLEMDLWQQLHRDGLLRLYMGP